MKIPTNLDQAMRRRGWRSCAVSNESATLPARFECQRGIWDVSDQRIRIARWLDGIEVDARIGSDPPALWDCSQPVVRMERRHSENVVTQD